MQTSLTHMFLQIALQLNSVLTSVRWKLTSLPKRVGVYGDGNVKVFFVYEDDVGTYTIKSIDDPRTLNKTIYIRPQDNCLT